MKSQATLFIFAQIAPLENCPVEHIKSVELIGDRAYFNIVDDTGLKVRFDKPKSEFIMQQVREYGLITYGE